MEQGRRIETKTVRVSKYLAQLTKNGLMEPRFAAELMKRYNREKDINQVLDEIVMLPSPEGKESVLTNVINMMTNDTILNKA